MSVLGDLLRRDRKGAIRRRVVMCEGWTCDGRHYDAALVRGLYENSNRRLAFGEIIPAHPEHWPKEPGLKAKVVGLRLLEGWKAPGVDGRRLALEADIWSSAEALDWFDSGEYPNVSPAFIETATALDGSMNGPYLVHVALLGNTPPAMPAMTATHLAAKGRKGYSVTPVGEVGLVLLSAQYGDYMPETIQQYIASLRTVSAQTATIADGLEKMLAGEGEGAPDGEGTPVVTPPENAPEAAAMDEKERKELEDKVADEEVEKLAADGFLKADERDRFLRLVRLARADDRKLTFLSAVNQVAADLRVGTPRKPGAPGAGGSGSLPSNPQGGTPVVITTLSAIPDPGIRSYAERLADGFRSMIQTGTDAEKNFRAAELASARINNEAQKAGQTWVFKPAKPGTSEGK